MPYVAVGVYSYSLKAEYHPCFVKIVRKKNTIFVFALRKLHRNRSTLSDDRGKYWLPQRQADCPRKPGIRRGREPDVLP